MIQMRLAFYRADRGGLFDKLIAIWTSICLSIRYFRIINLPYSHVELVFSNNECFSSSYIDGGVRFIFINLESGKWDLVEYAVEGTENDVRERCQQYVGAKYDCIGILFHQFLPFNIENPKKWWCSEIVSNIINLKNSRISPNKMYLIIKGAI